MHVFFNYEQNSPKFVCRRDALCTTRLDVSPRFAFWVVPIFHWPHEWGGAQPNRRALALSFDWTHRSASAPSQDPKKDATSSWPPPPVAASSAVSGRSAAARRNDHGVVATQDSDKTKDLPTVRCQPAGPNANAADLTTHTRGSDFGWADALDGRYSNRLEWKPLAWPRRQIMIPPTIDQLWQIEHARRGESVQLSIDHAASAALMVRDRCEQGCRQCQPKLEILSSGV